MIEITFVLIGIVVLFALLVAFRSIGVFKICALCGAVSIAWLTLLVLFYANYEINPVLIGILMGGSVVGLMHLLEQKLPEKYQLFKLPFFITFVFLVYFVLEKSVFIGAIVVVVLTWFVAVVIHIGRRTEGLKALGKKIIECCKNW